MYVLDMHCHILPGVDDGAKDEAMSMEMLGIAYSQGIRKMILTPHYYVGKNKYQAADFRRIFSDFAVKANIKYPDLKLYLGNEIYYTKGALDEVRAGNICTLADTKYVLIEFSPRVSYNELYNAVREFVQGRYRPVIAHVERYQCLTRRMERIAELTENGAYLQMNADSMTGSMFDGQTKWCRKLVTEGYISVIGTDAHNIEDRAPYVQQTIEWMQKKLDKETMEMMLHGNGELMLENKYL